ncbi:hypothetical protein [Amycolatopsis jejuensis]|uniref:hypothetical protein n=1 Tax=Amycolatopsis jejuensis TaxID=330084 RepID=UPI0005247D36|nr:hypothetical protein [Amycolatopsis jejuensis]
MATPPRVPLALLDALVVGLALGYLARHYRDLLVAHGAVASLAAVVAVGGAVLLRAAYRAFGTANTRLNTILAEELPPRRPSPRPRR